VSFSVTNRKHGFYSRFPWKGCVLPFATFNLHYLILIQTLSTYMYLTVLTGFSRSICCFLVFCIVCQNIAFEKCILLKIKYVRNFKNDDFWRTSFSCVRRVQFHPQMTKSWVLERWRQMACFLRFRTRFYIKIVKHITSKNWVDFYSFSSSKFQNDDFDYFTISLFVTFIIYPNWTFRNYTKL
jgi:hypothetical protein